MTRNHGQDRTRTTVGHQRDRAGVDGRRHQFCLSACVATTSGKCRRQIGDDSQVAALIQHR